MLLALLGATPSFQVPSGGSLTFTRYLGVGDGDGSNAFELEQRLNGTAVGTLNGCITAGGTPVAGAKVTAGLRLISGAAADKPASTEILGAFVTKPGPCPNYSGTVRSGEVQVAASKQGHLYQGNFVVPALTHIIPAPPHVIPAQEGVAKVLSLLYGGSLSRLYFRLVGVSRTKQQSIYQ